MLILSATTDLVRVITSATGDIMVQASYVDWNGTAATPARTNTLITTATTTTIVASPGASVQRTVKRLNVRNNHATTSNDITVLHTDGTSIVNMVKVTLAPSETLTMSDAGVWFVYDSSGGVKAGANAASDTLAGTIEIAVQSEMETGTDTTRAVTPGRQQFHAGHPKCWVVAGVTGNILASYNITSLTDTGTGDIAVTIANDFSSVNYAVSMAVQRINSTAAEANSRIGTIKTASLAAGSFSMDCWDTTTTTNVIKDPTTWHAIACGDQ